MSSVRHLLLLVLIACRAPAAPPGPANHAAPPTAAPPAPVAGERRCLPVVAADCGCVYTCGVGTRAGDGWTVTHGFWTEPLRARLDRWCVDGQCSEAWFGEIVCSGICVPRPADATCHFDDAGACVGAS